MLWTVFRSHLRYLSERDLERTRKAFTMANKAHEGQFRKSGEPYIAHPVAVADALADIGADADTLIAALLHDTLEDTTLTLGEIKRAFGDGAADLVDGVTKLAKEEIGGKPTVDEQLETLRKIFTLMEKDVRIMVIKLFDRLHNMQTVEFLSTEKQKKLAQETRDVYVKIAERLCMRDLQNDLEELCISVLEPENIEALRQKKLFNEQCGQEIMTTMHHELQKHFSPLMRTITLTFEAKTWQDLHAQIKSTGAATGISDVTVVYICPTIDECYHCMGALHQLWQRETLSFQDYINAPLLNGYKGLHTTVILPKGTRVRCKIRTPEMQSYAQGGIATRCFKGKTLGLPEYLPWARRISPLSADTQDRSSAFWESLQSDILGESIIIHGPDDGTAGIPKGSTALDGAFYLFHDLALRTQGITVNGKDAPFSQQLHHGDSLTITMGKADCFERSWLEDVKSGIATATIRAALRKQPEEQKIATGRQLLTLNMQKHHQGFLEEFDESILAARLHPLGLTTLQEACIALADGVVEAEQIYSTLFGKEQHKGARGIREPTIVHFSADATVSGTTHILLEMQEKFPGTLRSVQFDHEKLSNITTVHSIFSCTPTERTALGKMLEHMAVMGIRVESQNERRIRVLLSIFLTLLWGLDPVFAKLILSLGVTSTSFTIIRLLSVFAFSAVLFGFQWRQRLFARISLRTPSLWIAGIALFFVSLVTYPALFSGTPELYNTIIRGNAFLVALTTLHRIRSKPQMFFASVLTLIGFAWLFIGEHVSRALLLSFGVLGCFFIYTSASAHFQNKMHVLARQSQFFFFTSFIALLCSLLLPFVVLIQFPTMRITFLVAAYAMTFVAIPYVLFYNLTRRYGYATVSQELSLSIIVTFLAGAFLQGTASILHLIAPAIFITAGSMIATRVLNKEVSPQQEI